MAIVRMNQNLWENNVETVKAFHENFPDAKPIPLPEGAQNYKLFEINGQIKMFTPDGVKKETLPDDDTLIELLFVRRPDIDGNTSKPILGGWRTTFYNGADGKIIHKKLGD